MPKVVVEYKGNFEEFKIISALIRERLSNNGFKPNNYREIYKKIEGVGKVVYRYSSLPFGLTNQSLEKIVGDLELGRYRVS